MIPDHDSKEIADYLSKNADFIEVDQGCEGRKRQQG